MSIYQSIPRVLTRARGTWVRLSGRRPPLSIVPETSQKESGPTKISGTRSTLVNPRTAPLFDLRSRAVVPTHQVCAAPPVCHFFQQNPVIPVLCSHDWISALPTQLCLQLKQQASLQQGLYPSPPEFHSHVNALTTQNSVSATTSQSVLFKNNHTHTPPLKPTDGQFDAMQIL